LYHSKAATASVYLRWLLFFILKIERIDTMRLPNGYGSVTKLSGKRRNPYVVRISGAPEWDDEKQDFVRKRMILGYYKDRKSALQALSDYNDSPYSLSDNNSTFSDLWEEWKKTNYPKLCDQ
jgi:hypothetical protein